LTAFQIVYGGAKISFLLGGLRDYSYSEQSAPHILENYYQLRSNETTSDTSGGLNTTLTNHPDSSNHNDHHVTLPSKEQETSLLQVTITDANTNTIPNSTGASASARITSNSTSNSTSNTSSAGQERLLKILEQANVEELNINSKAKLPTWDQVEELYGTGGPKIVGLERCQEFRDTVPAANRIAAPAGWYVEYRYQCSLYCIT